MHLQENTVFDLLALTFRVKIMKYAQNLLHYVTYAAAKFEVATSIGLGEYPFTRKYII